MGKEMKARRVALDTRDVFEKAFDAPGPVRTGTVPLAPSLSPGVDAGAYRDLQRQRRTNRSMTVPLPRSMRNESPLSDPVLQPALPRNKYRQQ